jgi:hypothetical protein
MNGNHGEDEKENLRYSTKSRRGFGGSMSSKFNREHTINGSAVLAAKDLTERSGM